MNEEKAWRFMIKNITQRDSNFKKRNVWHKWKVVEDEEREVGSRECRDLKKGKSLDYSKAVKSHQ